MTREVMAIEQLFGEFDRNSDSIQSYNNACSCGCSCSCGCGCSCSCGCSCGCG